MTIKEDVNQQLDDEERAVEGQQQREFPDAFYCGTSHQIMKDPVVDGQGDSHDRSAVAKEQGTTYYPNRALKAIIDAAVLEKAEEGSLRGKLRKMDTSVRAGWSKMVEKSAFPSPEHRPLPEQYYGAITFEIMLEPVICPEGNSFEKLAIHNWIRKNGNSPLTRTPLTVEELRPNHALQDLIDEELKRSDESIHASIRRWKESRATEPQLGESAEPDIEIGATATTQQQTYPTTPAQLEARQRERRQRARVGWTPLLFALFVVAMVAPYLVWVFFFLVILFCCIKAARDGREGEE